MGCNDNECALCSDMHWEYKEIELDLAGGKYALANMNKLGREGWELICMVPNHSSTFYFKRKVRTTCQSSK